MPGSGRDPHALQFSRAMKTYSPGRCGFKPGRIQRHLERLDANRAASIREYAAHAEELRRRLKHLLWTQPTRTLRVWVLDLLRRLDGYLKRRGFILRGGDFASAETGGGPGSGSPEAPGRGRAPGADQSPGDDGVQRGLRGALHRGRGLCGVLL